MACNRKMAHRHNSYITKKIPYRRILNGIKIVKLSKQPLSITHKGKEKNILLARIQRISVIKEIKKSKSL